MHDDLIYEIFTIVRLKGLKNTLKPFKGPVNMPLASIFHMW